MEYRPLEGFVFAVTPFNFTAIGGNLPTAPALMGNTVVWKPASTAMLSAYYMMRLFEEAGLPPRRHQPRLRLRRRDRRRRRSRAATSPASTSPARPRSSRACGRRSATNIARYRNYPRIVGETGGKDFIVAHPSADVEARRDRDRARLVRVPGPEVLGRLARLRARRTSGRSCGSGSSSRSASSRWATSPTSRTSWARSSTRASFETQREAIEEAKADAKTRGRRRRRLRRQRGLLRRADGDRDERPDFRLLRDELFGPVVTAYVYPDGQLGRDARADRPHGAVRPDRRGLLRRPRGRDRGRGRRCATRPGTSTSTTSRPARSSASSRSAARGPRGRTTRRARCGT